MTDRPILFSGPMVRALLDGRKTQTRRVVKCKTGDLFDVNACLGAVQEWRPEFDPVANAVVGRGSAVIRCPYGVLGDRLYVRETWKPHSTFAGLKPRDIPESNVFYQADDAYAPSNTPWKPGIHMPRWASRLTLNVTGIRVERLQDCSEADAIAEGVHRIWERHAPGTGPDTGPNHYTVDIGMFSANAPTAAGVYRMLWEAINGEDRWAANPWVWVVEFEVAG